MNFEINNASSAVNQSFHVFAFDIILQTSDNYVHLSKGKRAPAGLWLLLPLVMSYLLTQRSTNKAQREGFS